VNRHQRRLHGIVEAQKEHVHAYKAIWKRADDENREPSEEERLEVEAHMKSIEDLNGEKAEVEATLQTLKRVDDLGREIGIEDDGGNTNSPAPRAKTLGDQFINSTGYKNQREKGFSGNWKTGQIELQTKTTLTEGDNPFLEGGTAGDGGHLVPLDQRPGILPILFERLTVADLFASGTTDSNAINYVQETVATNAAGRVAEGAAKPEAALAFDNVQEAVKKLAVFLPVSDEMLDDAPALRSYINSRLTLFVRQEEEEQLLHGAGGSNFLGLLPRIPAANRYVTSSATSPNAADHIYEALTVARRSFLEPDGIIVHPDDWADLRLLKDGNDNYIGGSPFSNTGNGEPGDRLWGKRVVVTTAMFQGAAVVGAFGAAGQVFRRTGLAVEASNSHSDYFVKNLTAIRAEERLALAVYRPASFAIADIGYPS
jgi:HK97 family phage major capsid protein